MVAISLSLLFATINSCLVILQVTLHCYFLSTDNIFCHIGVQKDVLCLPNSLARLRICLGGYGGVDGAEACALQHEKVYKAQLTVYVLGKIAKEDPTQCPS